MRKLIPLTAAAFCLGGLAWAGTELLREPYAGTVGITYTDVPAPLRETSLDLHLWYPAQPGGRAVTVGGNGVFHGTPAGRDAPMAEGRHPLILISHGAGGNAGQFGWIAAQLAEAGYVVALPNHPGSTSHNASAEAAVRIWERPQDLSAVLDEITANPEAYPFIDPTRIGVLGFSAGGYTALAVSGARVDPDRLAAFCDQGGRGMSDCDFFARFGVDLHRMDLQPAGQDLRDPRISFAVVVDPGIVETLTQESLATIDIPMLVLNLGAESEVPAPVHARAVAETVAQADYHLVPGALHFSFLAECKPAGAQILADEGEADPLCADGAGGERTRAQLHADMAERILTFLQGVTGGARGA
ncbi:prolyl oligopeptidase family serine peptidase [Cereibacter sphaeroides]|nr:prolyl oligopeptidase family serine peptidase [Cereibacter sphaeroides]